MCRRERARARLLLLASRAWRFYDLSGCIYDPPPTVTVCSFLECTLVYLLFFSSFSFMSHATGSGPTTAAARGSQWLALTVDRRQNVTCTRTLCNMQFGFYNRWNGKREGGWEMGMKAKPGKIHKQKVGPCFPPFPCQLSPFRPRALNHIGDRESAALMVLCARCILVHNHTHTHTRAFHCVSWVLRGDEIKFYDVFI